MGRTARIGVAGAAAAAVLAGSGAMLAALVAAPGSWLEGYVSEAGTAGQPLAAAYRWGLILLAGGVALLAVALAPRTRTAAALLGLAAPLALTSAAVRCSHECPLPPREPTTVPDVVHAGAGIAGMMLLAGAMAVLAATPVRPALRRLAIAGAVSTVPLGAAFGLALLVAGRGPVTAITERILLAVAVCWLAATAVALVPE
jgi:hypothetical protein